MQNSSRQIATIARKGTNCDYCPERYNTTIAQVQIATIATRYNTTIAQVQIATIARKGTIRQLPGKVQVADRLWTANYQVEEGADKPLNYGGSKKGGDKQQQWQQATGGSVYA